MALIKGGSYKTMRPRADRDRSIQPSLHTRATPPPA
jgi:hypothetical protein